MKAQKLPPGARVPDEWSLVGVGTREPEAAPVETAAPGRAGVDGTGGAAWRRRLAPHHREVVKRFFETGSTTGK